MNYALGASQPNESISKEILLAPGINSFCVDRFGTYNLLFSGCHTYDSNTPTLFKTGDKNPVIVNAIKHRNGVRILSDVRSVFKVLVEMENGDKQHITFIEEPNKVNNQYTYRYDFDLQQTEKLTLTPQSDIVLFSPQSREILGASDCIEVCTFYFYLFTTFKMIFIEF